MNVLFLTLVEINSLSDRGIYQDLLREFIKEGHQLAIVTPVERKRKIDTNIRIEDGAQILQVKTLNIQKSNLIEKGIGTIAIEYQYLSAIKKYFSHIKFDVVLFSTPPITFSKVVRYVKKRDNAFSYLLLKDIFPQNAIDMKMFKEGSIIHKYFRKKEKVLYNTSDFIGCMSQANVDYILKHNPEISSNKLEVNPNSIEPIPFNFSKEQKVKTRLEYKLPLDKKILIYGGNLGKPQGVDFLLDLISSNKNENIFFLIVGSGTESPKMKKWFQLNKPSNAKFIESLPKKEYDLLLASCDVGLIFLHKDFTIPNFPSRLLSYLEMYKPVISITDLNSDIGDVIVSANCGMKAVAGDIIQVNKVIDEMLMDTDLEELGKNARRLLESDFTVEKSYNLISEKVKSHKLK